MHVALGSVLSTQPPVEERDSWVLRKEHYGSLWVSKALHDKKTGEGSWEATVSPGTDGRNVAGSQQLLLSAV